MVYNKYMEEFEQGGGFLQRNKLAIVVLAVIVVIGFLIYKGADKVINSRIDGMTTITGNFTCLPLKDVEAEIKDCSLGIRSRDGSYYALNVSRVQDANIDLRAEDTIAVTGTLEPETSLSDPRWIDYNVRGVVQVNTLLRTR